MTNETTIYKGLMGVTVDSTSISKVMPEINALTYRGYPVQHLCEHADFMDTAWLLWHGELPNESDKKTFVEQEKSLRSLDDALKSMIVSLPVDSHPMDVLRTAISFIGASSCSKHDDLSQTPDPKKLYESSVALLAKIPTIIAADYRRRKGLDIIDPDSTLGFNENFFFMCFGTVPNETVIKAFDVSMILYAEHSFNASTFTSRVITSSLSDLYGAVTGAIASLKGPLHGGANEAVMHMVNEVGSKDKAKEWMLTALREKRKIMGFGHRVYKKGDSRVPTMTHYYHELAKLAGREDMMNISTILEQTMIDEKNIYPNLDFPAGPAYFLMGFDIEFFTPLFVMSRVTGWTAHIMEQFSDNRLIRPLSAYHGVGERYTA